MLAAFHEKKEVVLALWKYQQSMSTLRICKHCLLWDCHEIILSWARPLASLSTHTAPARSGRAKPGLVPSLLSVPASATSSDESAPEPEQAEEFFLCLDIYKS